MSSLSEVAANLQAALAESQKLHKALEDARAKLAPLETEAKEADEKVSGLMAEYQSLANPEEAVDGRKRRGPKQKRAPRSIEAILSTSAVRLLKGMKKEGKTKKVALASVLERAGSLASSRGASLTPDLKAMIEQKAGEIF